MPSVSETTSGSGEREQLDDRALLAAHVDGDPVAFDLIVRRHRDRMWAVALRTLGDRDDASDAVQDALLSAFRSAKSYRGEAAVSTWLHRIVVNACLDLTRKRTSRPSVPLLDRDVASAVDQIEQRDVALAAVAALRDLPIEQSAALVLVDIEAFSVSEAAGILGIAEGTVKSRCARGRARLAVLLARNDAEPTDVQSRTDGGET